MSIKEGIKTLLEYNPLYNDQWDRLYIMKAIYHPLYLTREDAWVMSKKLVLITTIIALSFFGGGMFVSWLIFSPEETEEERIIELERFEITGDVLNRKGRFLKQKDDSEAYKDLFTTLEAKSKELSVKIENFNTLFDRKIEENEKMVEKKKELKTEKNKENKKKIEEEIKELEKKLEEEKEKALEESIKEIGEGDSISNYFKVCYKIIEKTEECKKDEEDKDRDSRIKKSKSGFKKKGQEIKDFLRTLKKNTLYFEEVKFDEKVDSLGSDEIKKQYNKE
eukprot:GHVP01023296.1.p1 GENE.GHVP01023296.1~~GHVP01023296.1.p1  ORF type:complete len:279 (+),score=74.83 GHVP01023296.1:114-950(+)